MSESVFGTVKTEPITANELYVSNVSADGVTFNPDGDMTDFSIGWKDKISNMKFNETKTTDGFNFGEMFTGKNIGGTLQGVGAIGGALASAYGIHETKKFNKDMLDMEKKRVGRETKRQDDKQAKYEAVWATDDTST